ncbi:MAG: glycosyltransferase family 1 protein [Bacteroidales bacterium]
MKGLYLHFFGLNNFSGISKKINYQIEALERCGLEMHLCTVEIDSKGVQRRVCNDKEIDNFGNGVFAKFGKWILFNNLFKYIIENGIEFLYVRSFYNTNLMLLRMFSKLKKHGVKVVVEYPTYPYDIETKSEHIRYQPIFFLNRIFRGFLKGRVERVVTFTELKEIDGVKCVNISNAIDFNSIKLSKRPVFDGSYFSMIAVAEVHFWHGYDRVIRGLNNYYNSNLLDDNKVEVHFNIVGEGSIPDRDALIKLTKELSLDNYVHFYNNQYGEALDLLFEQSHFAIASLGRHRTGISKIKTLKNREYAARGLSFAYSENDSDFDNMPYVFKIKPNESAVDIVSLLDFYRGLDISPQEIRRSIENKLSWDIQMKKVLKSIDLY